MGKRLSEMTLEELWELFPIIIREHNPCYKEWYLTEKSEIEKAIDKSIFRRINHIGSSAVEGLIAKPTVDILLELDELSDMTEIKQKLVDAGWVVMSYQEEPEFKMSLNKGYTAEGFAEKVFHLHVRHAGDWSELYFRDYLIDHPDVAKEYGRLKLQLREQYLHDRDSYTSEKTEFVMKYSQIAKAEFCNKYLPV